jgi:fumarate reductase subunit D
METSPKDEVEIREGKVFAVLAYLSILCILPLILKKENHFAFFHGKQGLVLFIAEVAALVVGVLPIIGQVIFQTSVFIFGVISIWCIIQVLRGAYLKIPIISNIAEKIIL